MLFRMLLGASAAAVAAAGGQINIAWKDCGDADTHGKTTSLEPSTATLGEKTSIVGKGSVDEDISGGSFELTVSVPILGKLLDHTGDICTAESISLPLSLGTLDWKGMSCPVSAGAVEIDMDMTLSSSIPSSAAKTTVNLSGKSTSGDKLLCVQLQTTAAAEENG